MSENNFWNTVGTIAAVGLAAGGLALTIKEFYDWKKESDARHKATMDRINNTIREIQAETEQIEKDIERRRQERQERKSKFDKNLRDIQKHTSILEALHDLHNLKNYDASLLPTTATVRRMVKIHTMCKECGWNKSTMPTAHKNAFERLFFRAATEHLQTMNHSKIILETLGYQESIFDRAA